MHLRRPLDAGQLHSKRETAGTKAQARSAITNGRKLFEHKRTRERSQRCFRDLLEAYTEQYEIATEADKALVRNTATLTFEEMAAAKMRGERVNGDDLVRMSSELRRVLSELGRKAQANAPAAPTIAAHWDANHDNDEGSDA